MVGEGPEAAARPPPPGWPAGKWLLLKPLTPLAAQLAFASPDAQGRAVAWPGPGVAVAPGTGLVVGRGTKGPQTLRLPANWLHCSSKHFEVSWSGGPGGAAGPVLWDRSTNGTFTASGDRGAMVRVPKNESRSLEVGSWVQFSSGLGEEASEGTLVRFAVEALEEPPAAPPADPRRDSAGGSPGKRGREPSVTARSTKAARNSIEQVDKRTLDSEALKPALELERSNNELRNKLEEERQKVLHLQEELSGANQVTTEFKNDAAVRLADLENKARDAERKMVDAAGEKELLAAQAGRLQAELDCLKRERDNSREQVADLRKRCATLEAEKTKMAGEAQQVAARLAREEDARGAHREKALVTQVQLRAIHEAGMAQEKRMEAVLREAAVLNARLKEAFGQVGRLADSPTKGGPKDGDAPAGEVPRAGGVPSSGPGTSPPAAGTQKMDCRSQSPPADEKPGPAPPPAEGGGVLLASGLPGSTGAGAHDKEATASPPEREPLAPVDATTEIPKAADSAAPPGAGKGGPEPVADKENQEK